MYGSDGQDNVPHREWLIVFDRVLKEVKEEMVLQGRTDDFFGARVSCTVILIDFRSITWAVRPQIIYSTIRFISSAELEWYFDDCIALKKEFPHLIAGVAFMFLHSLVLTGKHRL